MTQRPVSPGRGTAGTDRLVVVVTGASSGIGRATAHRFARDGATLVLASRSEQPLRDAADECLAAGAADTLVVPTDVSDEAAVQALAAAAVESYGRIDVWVESAAVMAYGRFEDVPTSVFRRVVETNIFGTVHAAKAVLPLFRAQRQGRLIVVGSLVGRIAAPFMSPYVTSKWALRGLTRTLRQETRDVRDVHVCLVLPNGVNTPIYEQAANYVGRAGRPPMPVDSPAWVARVIHRLVEHPRREVLVGPTSRIIVLGNQLTPALFDLLVAPLMRIAAMGSRPVGADPGNVLAPRPEDEATNGRWHTFR